VAGVLSVGVLVWVVMRDAPHIKQAQQDYLEDGNQHLQPRFWAQGVIALRRQ
jgi:hypothetical protein